MPLQFNYKLSALNPNYGKRTGRDVLAGKIIRKLPDGSDMFDDYFTDSENEVLEITKENSPSYDKENETNRLNQQNEVGQEYSVKQHATPKSAKLALNGNSTGSFTETQKGGNTPYHVHTNRTLRFSDSDQSPTGKKEKVTQKEDKLITSKVKNSTPKAKSKETAFDILTQSDATFTKEVSSLPFNLHMDPDLFSDNENDDDDGNFTFVLTNRKCVSENVDKKSKSPQKSGKKKSPQKPEKEKAKPPQKNAEKVNKPSLIPISINKNRKNEVFNFSNTNKSTNKEMDTLQEKEINTSHYNKVQKEKSLNECEESGQADIGESFAEFVSPQNNIESIVAQKQGTSSRNKQSSINNTRLNFTSDNKRLVDTPLSSGLRNPGRKQIIGKGLEKSLETPVQKKQSNVKLTKERSNREKKMSKNAKSKNIQRGRKVSFQSDDSDSDTPVAIRKTKRHCIQPLEHWRNQRIKYDCDGTAIEIESGSKSPTPKKRTKSRITTRKWALPNSSQVDLSIHDETVNKCENSNMTSVFIPETNSEIQLSGLYVTYKTLEWCNESCELPSKDDPFIIKRYVCTDNELIGLIKIRPLQEKPKENCIGVSLRYFILHGKLRICINENSFILQTADYFLVPDGVSYSIKNMRKDEAELFFRVMKHPMFNDDEI